MPGGVAFYGTENSLLRVRFKGSSTWYVVPGISSYREEGGKKPIREAVAFQGVGSKSGKPRVPEIITNLVYAPLNQVMFDINTRYKSGELIDAELFVPGDVIYEGVDAVSEVAIAADGLVTFSGTSKIPIAGNALIEPGLSIKQGDDYYMIDQINLKTGKKGLVDADYEMKVRPLPDAAVDATHEFEVQLSPFSRGPVPSEITQSGYIEGDSESNITSVLSLQPRSLLPEVKRGLSA